MLLHHEEKSKKSVLGVIVFRVGYVFFIQTLFQILFALTPHNHRGNIVGRTERGNFKHFRAGRHTEQQNEAAAFCVSLPVIFSAL